MFERKITIPTLGAMAAEGSSKIWRGFITLQNFCESESTFALLVRGTQEGPSKEQTAAVAALINNSIEIKTAATTPLYQLFLDGGFISTRANDSQEVVWSLLRPGTLEIESASSEWGGAVYTKIGFTSELCPSAFPYISTLDGKFHEVSVET